MKKFILYPILFLTAISFITACGSDDDEVAPNTEKPADDGNHQGEDNVEGIIVTIDEQGNANEGHKFVKIDETNYYVDNLRYTEDNGELTVSGYYEAFLIDEAKIITALDYKGKRLMVRKIGEKAFKKCKVLTSITIPNSVTSIGEWAFSQCYGLTSITIPNSVTSIGENAISYCYGLTSITIGNNVTSIGESAFEDCQKLTSIIIPNSVTSIGKAAFRNCLQLTSITIGNSVTSIGESAFSRCGSISDVYCYAKQVPSADNNAFNVDNSSTTLHVPASSIIAYKEKTPWINFGSIVALTDNDPKTLDSDL